MLSARGIDNLFTGGFTYERRNVSIKNEALLISFVSLADAPLRPLDQGPGPVAPPSVPVSHFGMAGPPRGGASGMQAAMSGLSGLLQSGGLLAGRPDEEKAALIMQVLQLSDDQIAMLPDDQRKSIMILKEQVNRSGR